jgi:hypothetical protein
MISFPYGYTNYYLDSDLNANTVAIINRIANAVGGYNLSEDQEIALDNKVKSILTANGSLPVFWYDFNFSMDLLTAGATKVFNLGSSGDTGDGTLVNATQSTLIVTNAQGRKSARFTGTTNLDNGRITTSFPTLVNDQTFFAKLRLNSTGVIHPLFNASQTGASAINISTTTPRVRLDNAGVAVIGTSGSTLAISTDYSIAVTNSASKAFVGYINGANDSFTGTNPHAQTFLSRNLTIGTAAAGADRLRADVEGMMIFNTVLTAPQIASLNTIYT